MISDFDLYICMIIVKINIFEVLFLFDENISS